jgi:phage shock protein E
LAGQFHAHLPALDDTLRIMKTKWILSLCLISCLSCSGQSSNGPEHQASQKESGTAAKEPSDQIKEVSTSQLKDWLAVGEILTLIDVREENEWQDGHAATAMHIARGTLAEKIGTVVPDKTARIVLYCRSGGRSAASAATLQKMGYTNVFSLAGGFKSYELAGLPVRK